VTGRDFHALLFTCKVKLSSFVGKIITLLRNNVIVNFFMQVCAVKLYIRVAATYL